MESLNLVIKEQINNNAVDMVTFLEAVKEKVFDQQLEELVKGIYGIGEYRLVEELSSYQVDPVRWVSMTTDQRKALVEKVMCINIKDFERTPYDNTTLNLSISLKECVVINVLPLGTLEGLWERTKFLISNRSVIQLINGDFCVTDTEKAFNVKERKSPKLTYTCDCTKFQQLDGICSHVMAVAERKGSLSCVLEYYQEQGANTNKIINKCVPKGAGEKSHQRKPRKGKNNIRSEPITNLNTAEINTLTDPELDVEKQLEFSEYWHNEERLYVHQILDDECKRAKRCESCKVDFPKENPKIGSDFVVVQKERYMRPNFDSFGKRGEPILTTQLGRKFYCAKKKCLLKRHPYFWKGRLFMWRSVSLKLSPGHFEYLKKGLHFDMTAALLEQ